MIAIADALGAGAGKKLYTLRLDSNRWGDAGAIALAAAALNKALPVCEHLGLALNRISDRGVEVLTDVLARGALPACRWSWIRGNMARVELQEMYLSTFKERRDEVSRHCPPPPLPARAPPLPAQPPPARRLRAHGSLPTKVPPMPAAMRIHVCACAGQGGEGTRGQPQRRAAAG